MAVAKTLVTALLAGLVLWGHEPPAQTFEWQAATGESQGLSRRALDSLRDRLAPASKAMLVVRNDRLVYEWYAADHSAAARHYTASMAKAIVGGLATAVALTDRRVSLADRAADYIPQWKSDARKSRITLRHLGSHTSGLEDAEGDGLPHDKLTGWKGDFWKRLDPPRDPFTLARDLAPVLFDPGEQFQYSNPGIAMLTFALASALRHTGQADVRALLRDRVMRPIGVADEEWTLGYGATYVVDGLPLVAAWGGGGYTARAVARIGRLMLHKGNWDGSQLLTADAVRLVTTDAGLPGHGGIGWWSNSDGKYPALPRDAFWGSGAGHQVVFVVPSLNLIAVRNGASLGDGMEHHDRLNVEVFGPLVEAASAGPPAAAQAAAAPPYRPSPVIADLVWAPPDTIRRAAAGSDNWPLTWGNDDAMYGAYGDGQGFEPHVPKKLSMGFARITGGPHTFTGVNIRSTSGETVGDGAKGKKGSGLLMVDGVLYLWARNAGNSQLAWSGDRGATWTWSDWKFTSGFGAPTFLNFGRNYAGAPDRFVYIYSHDSDSAYTAADRMVLARVPSSAIRQREAYEFFKGLDGKQQPIWSKAIEERAAVFTNPGRCYRSGITYNAGLRRYLWSQTHPGTDARFEGGFAVYDAPAPWGPWTTVFHTDKWDVGPGDTSSFPTRWMSADGTEVHLVFSGDDAFSVRKATIVRRR
jgi:CubicO group peptidase (beta-lactamase class C family)